MAQWPRRDGSVIAITVLVTMAQWPHRDGSAIAITVMVAQW